MKQIVYVLGFVVLLAGILGSCKEDTLDTLRENEIIALDKYVADNKYTDAKDVSGIYFKPLVTSTDTLIKSGFKVMLFFKITLINGSVIFSTEDDAGRNYEEFAFFVDVSNDVVNQQYVQQIAGLHKGLKKMRVGEKAFMIIPSELAFKAVDNLSTLGIPRFSTLLATVTVVQGFSPAQLESQGGQ